LTGSYENVGYVEAMIGLLSLLTALPIGYIADKYGRFKKYIIIKKHILNKKY
jgi:hypothetical protein